MAEGLLQWRLWRAHGQECGPAGQMHALRQAVVNACCAGGWWRAAGCGTCMLCGRLVRAAGCSTCMLCGRLAVVHACCAGGWCGRTCRVEYTRLWSPTSTKLSLLRK
jgi:hypothetical protein